MLSIFIPSYNHARFVTDAIASARAVDVPGKHIYVIDDASTDGSPEVIESYLRTLQAEDVTLIRKPQNKGVVDSIITFLGLCRSEYMYLISSDDIAVPAGVAQLVVQMEATPTLQFVIGGGMNLMPDGRLLPLYGRRHDDLFAQPREQFMQSIYLMDSSPLLCQTTVYRVAALRAAEALDPNVVSDDYAIFSKLFALYNRRGTDFEFRPDVDCARYRHHNNNSYRQILRQVATSLEVLEASAPAHIRARAIAYKLTFYMLVAARRRDLKALVAIAAKMRPGTAVWLPFGLAAHLRWWIKYR